MKTLIILNFVTRELWKFNFSKENFGKENFGKENFSKENFGKENFGKEDFGKENFGKENFSKENFSKENFSKENFGKENFGKVLNFAEVESSKLSQSRGFVIRELTPKKTHPIKIKKARTPCFLWLIISTQKYQKKSFSLGSGKKIFYFQLFA